MTGISCLFFSIERHCTKKIRSKPKCFVSTPAAILVTGCCSKNAEGSRWKWMNFFSCRAFDSPNPSFHLLAVLILFCKVVGYEFFIFTQTQWIALALSHNCVVSADKKWVAVATFEINMQEKPCTRSRELKCAKTNWGPLMQPYCHASCILKVFITSLNC